MKRLIQLLPTHHRHDAIGAEALAIERVLGGAGWQVETYAEYIDPELQGRTLPIGELQNPGGGGAVALYHFAVCSDVTYRFLELDCPKALIYHNITPPEFFRPYDDGIAGVSEESLRQVCLLADHVDLGLGDSDFNRRDLVRMGYRATRTLPILFDAERYGEPPQAQAPRAGTPVVLTVGRVVPNKAPDDFIRAAAAYFELEGAPPARFVIAGKRNALPAYSERIEALIEETGLGEEQLRITGEISQEELIAAYRSAAAYVTLSRHEGFCVPILESWLFGVPVLALARAAVPETLGDAGLLIDSADPQSVARHIKRLLTDERLRADLINLGRARLARYDMRKWGFALRTMLEELCA